MRTCPNCQRTYPDETDFCPRDGTPLPPSLEATAASLEAGLSRRFRIVRRLGAGGMGSVFLAEQIGVGNRPVALKVLLRKLLDDPEFLLRFQNEAASTGRIRHANVVTIYESGQSDDGSPYIAMEYLEGETLRQTLKRRGALPLAECVDVLQQVARGLSSAHKLGILHRDLKPDNIFVTRTEDGDFLVKVVDFGLAKMRESITHTLTGTMLGTPAYMSPEQCLGMKSEQLDARSDLYALGIIAYEMLTGRVPFHSDTPIGYVHKHIMETPPPLRAAAPGLLAPPQVEAVVMKALAKDREQRQGSVLDLSREFAAAASVVISADTPAPSGATRVVERPAPVLRADSSATTEPTRPTAQPPGSRGASETAAETPTTPMRISPVPTPSPAAAQPAEKGAQTPTGSVPVTQPNVEEVVRWAENKAAKRGQQPTPWQRTTPSVLPVAIPLPGVPPSGPSPAAPRPPAQPERPGWLKYYIVAALLVIFATFGGYLYFQPSARTEMAQPQAPSPSAQPAPGTNAPLAGVVVRQNSKDGLKYVWIPPGTFTMGCSQGDSECSGDEKPAHQVSISNGFWIGQTPVTVGAYKRFTAATGQQMPSAPSFNANWMNESMPMVNVSWNDSQAYCQWAGGRLPSEAEWEYAARGGSTEARYGSLDEVAWYSGNSGGQTHDVAQKRANGFGLYDTLGNVWQWVNDRYDANYYQSSPSQDPPGPSSGQYRVMRGGSWGSDPGYVRVSSRGNYVPAFRFYYGGFRCVGEANIP